FGKQDKPRDDKELYEQFLRLQTHLLNSPIVNDSRGCRWRQESHRLNETRFFFYEFLDRKDVEANFTVAREFCNKLNEKGENYTGKWRLARVEELTTFRIIANDLEELARYHRNHSGTGFKDSWYWIDAYFNYTTKLYQNSDGEVLKFNSVLLYRHNRPLGIGAHEVHDKPFNLKENVIGTNPRQCLTFTLPWPNEAEKSNYKGRKFGNQASFDERACESVQKFKPLCENIDPKCRYAEDIRNFNYFPVEGYAQRSYVHDGMWIFANRRFLVNLKPRNKTESEELCKSLKTKLYTPDANDACIIPYLKLWNIRLTSFHFWTSLKARYHKEQKYSWMKYENGSYFALSKKGSYVAQNLTLDLDARAKELEWGPDEEQKGSIKHDFSLCVTANWGYEYENETAWVGNYDWNFLVFAFANCRLYMGTICEPLEVDHQDAHKCNWSQAGQPIMSVQFNYTAVIDFGFKGSGIFRSTYKQQFGQHICQTPDNMIKGIDFEITFDDYDYHLITENKLNNKDTYYYDYFEPYWVIDHRVSEEDWFKNATIDTEGCLVSQAVKYLPHQAIKSPSKGKLRLSTV
ncbi:hypothetical protein Ocin01_15869, partial [Orchesella cincta]